MNIQERAKRDAVMELIRVCEIAVRVRHGYEDRKEIDSCVDAIEQHLEACRVAGVDD